MREYLWVAFVLGIVLLSIDAAFVLAGWLGRRRPKNHKPCELCGRRRAILLRNGASCCRQCQNDLYQAFEAVLDEESDMERDRR